MPVDLGTLTRVDPGQVGAVGGRDRRADRAVALSYTDVVTQTALLGGAFSGVRRDSSCSSGGKTEDSLGRACVGPPRDDAKAHRTWDRGRRSSSSSSSSLPWGQWAVQLLQCTASLIWGSGECNSCNALPYCPGSVGSATPAMHCPTALGQ